MTASGQKPMSLDTLRLWAILRRRQGVEQRGWPALAEPCGVFDSARVQHGSGRQACAKSERATLEGTCAATHWCSRSCGVTRRTVRHRTASEGPRRPGRRSSSGGSAPRSRRLLSGQVSALAGLEAMVMDAEHGWGEPSTGPAPSSVGTLAVSTVPSPDSSLARPFDDRCRASSMISVTGLIAGSSRWAGRSRLRHQTRRSVHAAPAQSLGGARFGPFRPGEPGSQNRDHSMGLQLVRGPPDSSDPLADAEW